MFEDHKIPIPRILGLILLTLGLLLFLLGIFSANLACTNKENFTCIGMFASCDCYSQNHHIQTTECICTEKERLFKTFKKVDAESDVQKIFSSLTIVKYRSIIFSSLPINLFSGCQHRGRLAHLLGILYGSFAFTTIFVSIWCICCNYWVKRTIELWFIICVIQICYLSLVTLETKIIYIKDQITKQNITFIPQFSYYILITSMILNITGSLTYGYDFLKKNKY